MLGWLRKNEALALDRNGYRSTKVSSKAKSPRQENRKGTFDHLICDGINVGGGYVLASRVSVDFPESDLLQLFYRYQRLVHTGSSFSRHRRSTASGHVVACASEGVEQPACIKASENWCPWTSGCLTMER
jgi:hypothetical protein